MPLQPVYLVAVKNLGPFLDALRHAQTPEKVGLRFVEELGFKSTNDRLFVPLLKAMGFLDESGKPTQRYHGFLDDSEWKRVLADGIREAYSDLFRINRNANTLTRDKLAGKIRSLSEGKLSNAVVANMTRTFLELVKQADFSEPASGEPVPTDGQGEIEEPPAEPPGLAPRLVPAPDGQGMGAGLAAPSLVYRIEIVLPAVRDQAVYDAIFRSAREHLLS